MKKCLLLLSVLGCAHGDVASGLSTAQTGLAVVDVATDKTADTVTATVRALREYCDGSKACEKRLGVTDKDLAELLADFEILGQRYDTAAAVLQDVATMWGKIAPKIEALEEHRRGIDP